MRPEDVAFVVGNVLDEVVVLEVAQLSAGHREVLHVDVRQRELFNGPADPVLDVWRAPQRRI